MTNQLFTYTSNVRVSIYVSINNFINTNPNYSARDLNIINFDNYVIFGLCRLREAGKGTNPSHQ
ncbi:hypothetical protein [Runella aurantiaca]|uniref:hypothetical protein n=1 Tax=Runella aurantiaca TaxID=2282308 RepID=UPI0013143E37|nr:hypothetical protein [Runella aurantiaca]